jgi:hypothetical protein
VKRPRGRRTGTLARGRQRCGSLVFPTIGIVFPLQRIAVPNRSEYTRRSPSLDILSHLVETLSERLGWHVSFYLIVCSY